MNIYQTLKKPIMVLAPMDDVTDVVFRSIIADLAKPDLFFTEFVNVDGLQSPGRPKLLHKLLVSQSDTPIIAQVWGKNPENYYKTTKELKEMGFSGVDINMGCPVKTVVKNGCCAALMNNRELAKAIIEETKRGAGKDFPVSVKTRLGYDNEDFTWIEFLLEKNLDVLIIHGRTKKQMSKVPADWEAIGKVRELRDNISPNTLIIGNGDVKDIEHAKELAKKYKLDGIMIGRAIFDDPYLFSNQSQWEDLSVIVKKELFSKHIRLFVDTYRKKERNINILRKFCKVYINNFDGAKELREKLMKVNTSEDLLALLN